MSIPIRNFVCPMCQTEGKAPINCVQYCEKCGDTGPKKEMPEYLKAPPETPKETAQKHDYGKVMMGLISGTFLIGLARALTFGAKKYAAHNWRKGFAYSRPYDALQRHLVAYWMGEDNDPETGLSHLDHAACELMFLRELSETRKDLDDRYKTYGEEPK